MTTIEYLISKLAHYGGQIVLARDLLDEDLIAQARASKRLYTDCNGLEFVWEPIFKDDFPLTEEEKILWDECYPLDTTPDYDDFLDELMSHVDKQRTSRNDGFKNKGLVASLPEWTDTEFNAIFHKLTPGECIEYLHESDPLQIYNLKQQFINKYRQ